MIESVTVDHGGWRLVLLEFSVRSTARWSSCLLFAFLLVKCHPPKILFHLYKSQAASTVSAGFQGKKRKDASHTLEVGCSPHRPGRAVAEVRGGLREWECGSPGTYWNRPAFLHFLKMVSSAAFSSSHCVNKDGLSVLFVFCFVLEREVGGGTQRETVLSRPHPQWSPPRGLISRF